ncbi:MAG TPA: hypothetical protein VM010_00510 [Chitinophagaceae bacterium]|nr:hypothetical protein [Chitinophagaceae bacterium]
MKKSGWMAFYLFCSLMAVAQDTHYGTHQFGTRSALLGGAVVGGVRDNSMIFYNPAAIAFIDTSSFSITANIYQVENIRIQNILTNEKEFRSLQLTAVPLLTSGQFKTKSKNIRISYGVFSPVAFQFRGLARIEGEYEVVPDSESPGTETFVGDQNLFSRIREVNIAIGASLKLNEQWSVGLTNMIDVRSHHYNRALFTHYFLHNSAQTLVNTSFTQSFNYYNIRYMPKVGIAYRGANWSWGATATAPGLRLLGTGAVGVDILATNVKGGSAGRTTLFANGRQSGLKSYFKSPVSVATGIQYQLGKTQVLFSTQYFGKQKIYNQLKGEDVPFVRPEALYPLLDGDALLEVKTAARPVLNFAIGIEQELSKQLSLNASIRNNQSYYDAQLLFQNGIKPDITTWDLYHLAGGVTMRKERSSMSLGLALGVGRDKNRIDQALPLPSETDFFKTPITTTKGSYSSLGIIIGYNYFFKKG